MLMGNDQRCSLFNGITERKCHLKGSNVLSLHLILQMLRIYPNVCDGHMGVDPASGGPVHH